MVSLNDVLLAMSNIPVDDPIAEIWGRQMQGGYKNIEYTGTLPIAITANGDVLIDYRIYGADWGVGESTENLIRQVSTTQRVYLANQKYCLSKYVSVPTTGNKVSIVVYDANDVIIFNDYIGVWKSLTYDNTSGQGAYADITISYLYGGVNASFVVGASPNTAVPYPANYIPYGYKLPMTVHSENLLNSKITDVEQQVKIEPNTEYVLSRYTGLNGNRMYWAIYDESDVKIYGEDFMLYANAMKVPPKNNASYIKITIPGTAYDAVSIVKGTFINTATAVPSSYIPYSRTDTPVYIGENQLDAGEYVSFSEQKIYRDVSGTLTPTDPPVPFPEIPTMDGTTVIDYDGEPKPSQMYIKYKSKG